MVQPDDIDVEALIRAGKHREAASQLRRRGDLSRAQAIYEKIWDFVAAAEVARERGDRPALLRLLIDAKQPTEAAEIGRELLSAAPGEQALAAEAYEKRRMWAEAAVLRETLGQLAEAHAHYLKAQQPLEAARIDETIGRLREAGAAYERFLTDEPHSAEAPRAELALGRLLARFQRFEDAARRLQRAARADDPAIATPARRTLVVALAALGYREAASLVLEDLRKKERELPGLETFVSVERRALQSGGMARLGGRYTVRRLLGSGGMGRVYLARDEISGHDVAVKVVAAPQDARLRQGYDRFVREARVVSALKHPNLVGVVAFHETQGLLAMEYMAGGTLADRLPGPLPPALVRSLLVSLTSGLEAAHGHGVIHRDIKPQNVFFTQTGEAKLGDFGVAHLQDLGATQTAGFIGTLAYMSPEQISGAPLTFACDIYALGCTAYQALTGRLPFLGPDFVGQHLGEAAPPPTALNRALDPAWDALIARAMAKDPRDRFASLEELRRALAPIGAEPGAKRGAEPSPEGATAEARGPAQPRYAVGGSLGAGARGELLHATDTRLGREVVLERIPAEALEGEAGGALLAWLRALARHGGPRLQRILRLERLADGSLQAVFEAATGTPRPLETLSHAEAAELAAALAPLHAEGFAHGSLEGSIVSSALGPTLVCAGRAPTGVTPAQERALLNGAPRAR